MSSANGDSATHRAPLSTTGSETTAARAAVQQTVDALREQNLTPAQVVHALHTGAFDYTTTDVDDDPQTRGYNHAIATELRSAAYTISASDSAHGHWEDAHFVLDQSGHADHEDTTVPAPQQPVRSPQPQSNMGQYLRKPLLPPGYPAR